VIAAQTISATAALEQDAYQRLIRQSIFECCKWDPQLEDQCVISRFALVLPLEAWEELARTAEQLAAETLAMEQALLRRPDLLRRLGLPRPITKALRMAKAPAKGIARVMRFDFHPLADGWALSEVNCDVPGGFIESAGIARLVHANFPDLHLPAEPASAVAKALRRSVGENALVALVHATAYTDDRQVMTFLSRFLAEQGLRSELVGPEQLRWGDGAAHLHDGARVDAILRFYPAEWLPALGRRSGWQQFFRPSRTPACNPATALCVQSKRLPLVWDELEAPHVLWKRLLPETQDPRLVDWPHDSRWILKTALGRVGDGIGMRGQTQAREMKGLLRALRWSPGSLVAQRKFESQPIDTPRGPMHACLGVYTVDGTAAGVYGRIAPRPLIDHRAADVAVLVAGERQA
jgi:glutathionylspermidine synthase